MTGGPTTPPGCPAHPDAALVRLGGGVDETMRAVLYDECPVCRRMVVTRVEDCGGQLGLFDGGGASDA